VCNKKASDYHAVRTEHEHLKQKHLPLGGGEGGGFGKMIPLIIEVLQRIKSYAKEGHLSWK
jgi:hypothetical protein